MTDQVMPCKKHVYWINTVEFENFK